MFVEFPVGEEFVSKNQRANRVALFLEVYVVWRLPMVSTVLDSGVFRSSGGRQGFANGNCYFFRQNGIGVWEVKAGPIK